MVQAISSTVSIWTTAEASREAGTLACAGGFLNQSSLRSNGSSQRLTNNRMETALKPALECVEIAIDSPGGRYTGPSVGWLFEDFPANLPKMIASSLVS